MALVKLCPNCERRNDAVNTVCAFCGVELEHIAVETASDLVSPKITLNGRVLSLPLQLEIIIGRSDQHTDWMPDLDLAPYGGTANLGVSRKHARLIWFGHWQIEDLNSANGTFLNRTRVEAGKPLDLAPGSVIQIGRLYLVYHG